MKPKEEMLALHKTFDTDESQSTRDIVFYVNDGETAHRYSKSKEQEKFLASICPGTVVRVSAVNHADMVLILLAEKGAHIQHAHWHKLGIAKSSSAVEIAEGMFRAPEEAFRAFVPDKKIAALRQAVSMKRTLDQLEGDAVRRLKQIARNFGSPTIEDCVDEGLHQAYEEVGAIRKTFNYSEKNDKGVKKTTSWETRITKLARDIPLCAAFARVADVDSMGTAATVVAYLGAIERFDSVAALWHYCGQHVVDGKAPKRSKGNPMTWNPKLKTAMYLLGVSIQKQTGNRWNAIYKEYKAEELAAHADKCRDCKTPAGHCDARARRRMVKEILKQFYVLAKGEEWRADSAEAA